MPEDEVIEKNGLKVFMDKQISETLSGMQLDYYADEEREGFIFTGGVSVVQVVQLRINEQFLYDIHKRYSRHSCGSRNPE